MTTVRLASLVASIIDPVLLPPFHPCVYPLLMSSPGVSCPLKVSHRETSLSPSHEHKRGSLIIYSFIDLLSSRSPFKHSKEYRQLREYTSASLWPRRRRTRRWPR